MHRRGRARRIGLLIATAATTLFTTVLVASVAAQSPPVTQPPPELFHTRQILEGRYLEGLVGLERTQIRPDSSQHMIDVARSFIFGSMVEYVAPSEHSRCRERRDTDFMAGARPGDALSEIVRRARRARVVILNENHLEPRHRAFALLVARALRPLGFRYLAMEALTNYPDDARATESMTALSRRGYVTHSSGIYTNEPMFADFIGQAISMGYRPMAYEGRGAREAVNRAVAREEYQAQTINRRIIAADPEARVLVYVGFRHVTEAPYADDDGSDLEWMAMRLKRITGLDPLTIDQREHIPPGCLPADLIRRGLRASRFGDVIIRRNGTPIVTGAYRGAVDLEVVHLPVPPIHGRPAWMTQVGRRPLPIPARLLGNSTRRLVQAFARGSPPDAVPGDQIVVRPDETNPAPLMVRERSVTFRIQDEPNSAHPGH